MSDEPPVERPREPIFNDLPALVIGLAGAILVVSGAVIAGPESWRIAAYEVGAVVVGPGAPPRPLGDLPPFVLHAFLHGGWAHLLMNLAGLVAFGAPTARRLGRDAAGAAAFLILFFVAVAAGAGIEALRPATELTVLVGASGGVFGLIGGAIYTMASRRGRLASPFSPRILTLLAPWVGVNLAIALLGGDFMGARVAWLAHIGGLAAGWLLFPALVAVLDQKRLST